MGTSAGPDVIEPPTRRAAARAESAEISVPVTSASVVAYRAASAMTSGASRKVASRWSAIPAPSSLSQTSARSSVVTAGASSTSGWYASQSGCHGRSPTARTGTTDSASAANRVAGSCSASRSACTSTSPAPCSAASRVVTARTCRRSASGATRARSRARQPMPAADRAAAASDSPPEPRGERIQTRGSPAVTAAARRPSTSSRSTGTGRTSAGVSSGSASSTPTRWARTRSGTHSSRLSHSAGAGDTSSRPWRRVGAVGPR